MAYLSKGPIEKITAETSAKVSKIWTIIDKLLETHCTQHWELKTPRKPSHRRLSQYCKIYLQELDQVPTINIREKSPVLPEARGRKQPFQKTSEHSVLNKVYPQVKLVKLILTSWGIIKALGKGKTQLQLALAFHMGELKY